MIIEGNKVHPCHRCGQSKNLAAHLERKDTNEKVDVKEIRGFLSEDLKGVFQEIDVIGAGTRAKKPAYHAKIALPEGERLDDEQLQKTVDKLEKALGFEEQPRAVVEHEKDGRQHFHVVWSRIDVEKMKAIDTPDNYRKHEEVGRAMEKEFSLSKVQGAFAEREAGDPRPERNVPKWQYHQAERLGQISPRELKSRITEIYNQSESGKEFMAALEGTGWTLGQGKKTDFILIPEQGGEAVNLKRQIAGVKIADIRHKFTDIDRAKLPTEEKAKAAQLEGVAYYHTPEPPTNKTAAKIFEAYQEAQGDGQQFANSLPEKSCLLAQVTAKDVENFNAARAAAKEAGNRKQPPQLKEGDFVVVNQYSNVFKLNERTTGADPVAIDQSLKNVTAPSVQEALEQNRFAENLKGIDKEQQREQRREERQKEWEEAHQKTICQKAAKEIRAIKRDMDKMDDCGFRVIGQMANKAGKAVEKVSDVAEAIIDIFDPPVPRKITPQEMFANKEAQAERKAQLEAEKERNEALGRMAESIRKSKSVTLSDMRAMSRSDLEGMRDRGGDYIMLLIRQREKEEKLQRERRRER